MASPLVNTIQFLQNFGFYDVILPFLLIFTLVFAVLEKTRIFGVDKEKNPKKNINAMISFVIALFFVATPSFVAGIQVSLPQVATLLVILTSLMMLVGFFMSDKEFNFENQKGWKVFLSLLILVGLLAIFLNAFEWLDPLLGYIATQWDEELITSLILLAIIVGTIYYIVGGSKGGGGKAD